MPLRQSLQGIQSILDQYGIFEVLGQSWIIHDDGDASFCKRFFRIQVAVEILTLQSKE